MVFYFLSHTARQGVIIEKLMAWKLGSIYPARLPVNCKSSGKSQLPLWPSLHGKIENSGSSDIKGALQLEKSRIPDKCESKKTSPWKARNATECQGATARKRTVFVKSLEMWAPLQ